MLFTAREMIARSKNLSILQIDAFVTNIILRGEIISGRMAAIVTHAGLVNRHNM